MGALQVRTLPRYLGASFSAFQPHAGVTGEPEGVYG